MFGAVIDDNVDHNAGASSGAIAAAINPETLHDAPLPARAPILLELVEGILRVILRTLLPSGIGIVDSIGGVVILLLKRREKFLCNVLLRPKTIPPDHHSQSKNDNNDRDDPYAFLALALRMVFPCVQ